MTRSGLLQGRFSGRMVLVSGLTYLKNDDRCGVVIFETSQHGLDSGVERLGETRNFFMGSWDLIEEAEEWVSLGDHDPSRVSP